MHVSEIAALSRTLRDNIKQVIVGKDEVIDKVILSLLCSGHILLEDIPGTGKTTMAKALARSIDCRFKRIQFTPDLLPSDLTGINFYNQKESDFVFKEGAVFTNILLADEINRATPRTQSSLLECMEEMQVTVDGTTYRLDLPFLVVATQNPIEVQGTFPLPEAQLDRFFVKLSMGYPSPDFEREMLLNLVVAHPLESLEPVVKADVIVEAQKAVREVKVSQAVAGYIVALADASRRHDKVRIGISPRGTLALSRAAQAFAAMEGRDYVLPDDVKAVAYDVLCHRIICKGYNITQSNEGSAEVLRQLLSQVPVPTEASLRTGV